jgi:hypothetical protein
VLKTTVAIDAAERLSRPLRHVAWLIDAPVEARDDGTLTSPMASARYRCLAPVRELAKRGVQCSIFANLGRADPVAAARDLLQRRVDIVVTGKPLGRAMVETARLVRGQGVRLIADFCDDFFDHPHLGPLGHAMATLADGLVASTPSLAVALERHVGRRATIVSDPYEGLHGVARFAPRADRLELLWFGHDNHYPTIALALPQLLALSRRYPMRLTIVTALDRVPKRYASSSPSFLIDHAAWTPAGLWRRLADCDAVIIPSPRTPYFDAKSPNRLIEAIWAGRAVAACSVPSYGEFGAFCWLGDDIAAALAAMIADPRAAERRIAAGQTLVTHRHAPTVIAGQWLDCLLDASTSIDRARATPLT